jgi:hypothetical protein
MTEPERATKKRRAKRWTAARARTVLQRWRASGKSAAVFAAAQGITATRLSYWAKQLADVTEQPVPRFVAVSVGGVTSASSAAIAIELPGLTLRVDDKADALYVARLVAALRSQDVPGC